MKLSIELGDYRDWGEDCWTYFNRPMGETGPRYARDPWDWDFLELGARVADMFQLNVSGQFAVIRATNKPCDSHTSEAVDTGLVVKESSIARYTQLRCPDCGRVRGIRRKVK